ncbi:MAG: hypothetical protein US31_C0016G0015 [Berkelbacteria bacterium GW2011_GWA1_36_9]|uniref:ATP-grasp domain-containing protein n=1 Tax=Berkelbacteria bacterium GW2011_GWA1_36_9 TaxID=1618331 RepID=A0A0G0FFC3_9BACT|nr:MAG: hypothetical protein US31_C0016G0015 [Berkelbacteria bacterium GW2011_GWA1_36_9]
MNKKIKNIIIANDTEAFEFIINNIKDEAQRIKKINKEHFLSSRFLFWEGDDKIVITPFPIEDALLNQAKKIGYKNIENWYPSRVGISLSEAILRDNVLLEKLKKTINDNQGIVLSPYSFTRHFSSLVGFLREDGLKFYVDQEPLKNSEWLVTYLGSKLGFRMEVQKIKNAGGKIPTPEFFICRDIEEIIDAVVWFYQKRLSCVAKVFSGEGGWGVMMIKREDYSSEVDLRKKIKLELSGDSIWNYGPYIVEEFIPSKQNDERSPSLEVFINNKTVKITYTCNQIVDSYGRFIGILMGKNCLDINTEAKIRGIARTIGKRYSELGYRGFFDIDFIMSKKGITYPIETNVRRTGGTHVFDLTRHLFGSKWQDKIVALSSDSFYYGNNILSVKNILDKMSEINFPMKGEKKGVVVIAVDSHQPTLALVVFAPTKTEVMKIYAKLTDIYNKDNLNI